jgi:hypothetical protein
MLVQNPHLVNQPTPGNDYKLWSLPTGSSVIKKGLKVNNTDVGSFQIVKHDRDITICKTNWDYVFYLDSSLIVTSN